MMTNPPALVLGVLGLLLLRRVPILFLIPALALGCVAIDYILLSDHWERLGIQRNHGLAFLRYTAGFGLFLSFAAIVLTKLWGDNQ